MPLEQLYYKDKNACITTWIEEYKSEHGGQGVSRIDQEMFPHLSKEQRQTICAGIDKLMQALEAMKESASK